MKNVFEIKDDLYVQNLKTIGSKSFTRREIDVVACILHKRETKPIGKLLSISPKTVEAHIHNTISKIGCSSRDGIIKFFDLNGKYRITRQYYQNILVNSIFKEILCKKVSIINKSMYSCIVFVTQIQKSQIGFLSFLKDNLEIIGVTTSFEDNLEKLLRDCHINKVNDKSIIIIFPIVEIDISIKSIFNKLAEKNYLHCQIFIIFASEKSELFFVSEKIININLYWSKNHYYSFFYIIEKIIDKKSFNTVFDDFEKSFLKIYCDEGREAELSTHITHDKYSKLLIKNRLTTFLMKYKRILIISLLFFPICIDYDNKTIMNYPIKNSNIFSVRAELIIPNEDAFLDRQHLIKQIDAKFHSNKNIQAVALTGIAGSGKTTLARHYARQQDASVIWEINAETHNSLLHSFEKLACALCKTEENKKLLNEIYEIRDHLLREEKMLLFIKEQLKTLSNWIIIYDNVENFADIKNYFPHNSCLWGYGKIILTTRDSNVEMVSHIDDVVAINELMPEEKFDLFFKNIKYNKSMILNSTQINEIKKLLDILPSFPLDVLTSASYLKATDTTLMSYLEQMNNLSDKFIDNNREIIKGIGNYDNTRFSLTKMSIEKLCLINKEFIYLLYVLSLFDSQNITRAFLVRYKNNLVVDQFLHNLKKYSFISTHLSKNTHCATFYIHRKIQDIILIYLKNYLRPDDNQSILQDIIHKFENHLDKIIENEDLVEMKNVIQHCELLLLRPTLLTNTMQGIIASKLGIIYHYLGFYEQAKSMLEQSFTQLKKDEKKNLRKIACNLLYLANIYGSLGDQQKEIKFLNRSLSIYENNFPHDYVNITRILSELGNIYGAIGPCETAIKLLEKCLYLLNKHLPNNHARLSWTLLFLGYVYERMGNYTKAKDFFEQSLAVSQHEEPKNPVKIAYAIANIGNMHKELGNYDQAYDLIQQSLVLEQQNLKQDHSGILWTKIYLGDIEKEVGNFDKAKEYFEYVLKKWQVYLPSNHQKIALLLMLLGDTEKRKGDYSSAKQLLNKSIKIYKDHCGLNHVRYAEAIRILGQVYLMENNFVKAAQVTSEALRIFQVHNHSKRYLCLETLGDISIKIFESSKVTEYDLTQNPITEAKQHYQQALNIAKTYLADNSTHIKRINLKFNEICK